MKIPKIDEEKGEIPIEWVHPGDKRHFDKCSKCR